MLTDGQCAGIRMGTRVFFQNILLKSISAKEILIILQAAHDNTLSNKPAWDEFLTKHGATLRKCSDRFYPQIKYPQVWQHTLNGFFNADFEVLHHTVVINSNRDTCMVSPAC